MVVDAFCDVGHGSDLQIRGPSDRDATLGIGWLRGNWLPAGTGVVCNNWANNRESLVFYSIDPALKNFGIVVPDLDAISPCPSVDGEEIIFVSKRRL